MRPLLCVLALLSAGGCRRHHVPPEVEPEPLSATGGSDVPAAAPAGATPVDLALAAAAPSPSPGPSMPDGGTLNGDARGPRAGEFNRVVDAALPRIRQCFDAANLPVGEVGVLVHYIVEPPGYTGGITVHGSAPAAVQECARAVVNDLKFPAFHGHKVESNLPFTVKKTEKATRTEIWDAAPAPQP
jgi:hypothetical protein